MMNFLNLFSIPTDNYFKLKFPIITNKFNNSDFIEQSINFQSLNIINEFDLNKAIKNKKIYEIIYEVLDIFKKNKICDRIILYRFISVDAKNITLHLSPLVKYYLSKMPTSKIGIQLSKLVDYNLIDFTSGDNFEAKRNNLCKEFLLENLILGVSINIIYYHMSIHYNEYTKLDNIFQTCQENFCNGIMSHENKCFVHKNSDYNLTFIEDLKKDYPIEQQEICINCETNSSNSLFVSKSYITYCNNCTKSSDMSKTL